MSWIDPAFTTFNPLGFPPNDDHAPAEVTDGQNLVLAVYDALAASPVWERSLLVIVYDEHGGFYDHVPPPRAPDDDPAIFGRYGVRVPAIIVSPWVEPRSVSSTVFDHTSIIKSVLLRFCPQALNIRLPRTGPGGSARITRTIPAPGYLPMLPATLGELLTRTAPRPALLRDPLVMDAAARAGKQANGGNGATGQTGPGGGTSAHRPAEGLPRGGARTGQARTPGRQAVTREHRPSTHRSKRRHSSPLKWWRCSALSP